MSIIQAILAFALFVLVIGAFYHYLLLAASLSSFRSADNHQEPVAGLKFAIVIPAHNEASVIGRTVSFMFDMNYESDLYDVLVVADNCDDSTAIISRDGGATCYEREDKNSIGKGFALEWCLRNVVLKDERYDAVVVFDADSQPSRDFLTIMSSKLQCGFAVLQGQHLISNSSENTYTRLADIGMRLTNRLRNLARKNLGLSCRLMGDAMCFNRATLENHSWQAHSLVEDREYGIQLIERGYHIEYAPDAKSYGEAAVGLAEVQSQRIRWSGGAIGLRRNHAFSLLSKGLRTKDLSALDRAIELLLPPYSVLLIISIALLLLQMAIPLLNNSFSLSLSTGNAIAWLMIPPIGLILDRAPANLFPYILLGPFYTIWRSWIIVLALVHIDQIEWIRTKRSSE